MLAISGVLALSPEVDSCRPGMKSCHLRVGMNVGS